MSLGAALLMAVSSGPREASGQGAAGAETPSAARVGSPPSPGQRVALVTGSTDGLGREVARRLAAEGMHVIIHGRNLERGTAVVREIAASGRGSARFYPADLASLAQVRQLAAAIRQDYDRLDVLINNAGILLPTPARELSADGHELHFAVNYLAGFLLTHSLLPLIVESAPARIINVASGAQTPIDFADVMLERGYSSGRGYAQSKLAQVMFTIDLARDLEGSGVTVNTLHPATFMNTTMVRALGREPMSSVEEGTEAVMNLVTAPNPGNGQYYDGLRPTRAHAQAYDEAARERLRELSRVLTGL
jgi:NAD(P)-dependent dehydrogenase (short-subunit alcohol dehydrogenase family)